MPIYEYYCASCAREQEIFHLMKEDWSGVPCELCSDGVLERKISKLMKIKTSCKTNAKERIDDFISSSVKQLKEVKEELSGREKE